MSTRWLLLLLTPCTTSRRTSTTHNALSRRDSILWWCGWFPNIWIITAIVLLIWIPLLLINWLLELRFVSSLHITGSLTTKLIINVIAKVVIRVSSVMPKWLSSKSVKMRQSLLSWKRHYWIHQDVLVWCHNIHLHLVYWI